MLNFVSKIRYLELILNKEESNYADSFKTDILFYFDEFNTSNPKLGFLHNCTTYKMIDDLINKLTSRIVLKFDADFEQLSDFISEFFQIEENLIHNK